MNKNVNYGNWVPEKMLALCYVAAAVLGIAAYVTGPVLHLAIPTWILGILAAICLVYGIYMHICHELFAFGKGNMMAKVHQHLVDHLEWDGDGTLLDIGCGAAALTIRCAKAFPKAKLVGKELEEKARIIAGQTLKEALHGITLEELSIGQEVLKKVFFNTKD